MSRKRKALIPWESDLEDLQVTNLSVSYTQPGDCCDDHENFQTLTLTTEDGGGGPFIRMSIDEGKFFSVSDITDLQKIFSDFNQRLQYKAPK